MGLLVTEVDDPHAGQDPGEPRLAGPAMRRFDDGPLPSSANT